MSQNNDLDLSKQSKQRGISLDIIWFLVILAGFLFFTSLIPLAPNDFWWHLKIGEDIFTNHSIPTTNMFAWTLPSNQPFFYAAWLSELLFYLLYRLDGLALITSIRTILIAVAVWFIASEARRRSGSWRITALVTALLGLMITNNLLVRTQMWAWLPFVTTYIVLIRYSEGTSSWRWLLLCPASMILWVNVHGSYILGLIIPGAFFLGETIRTLLKQEKSLNWHQIGWIGSTGILSGLALLVNPRFTGIITYANNMRTNLFSQTLIEEWQSPIPKGIPNTSFYVSILLFIIVLAYSKYRLKPTEIILFGGFLWLAWSGQRFVIWYGLISMPILARVIKDLPIKTPTFIPQKNWGNLALAVILFIPVLAVQPWLVERMPLPDTYWRQVLRGSPAGALIGIDTPVAAAQYLKSHPGGHLYNEMGYGSYLIWAIPDQGVFVDPRVELFPYALWMDYVDVNNGTTYNEILAKYGVDRILLDKELQPNLAHLLSTDRLWYLEYDDQNAQIWSKASTP